ncbi:MAG: NifU family protein [Chloroflexota bacterium]
MDGPLLSVTPAAVAKIEAARKSGPGPDACLRIAIAGRGAGHFKYDLRLVAPDEVSRSDIVVDTPGMRVYVDEASADRLRGATVDLDASAVGGAITIINPNDGWTDPLSIRVQDVLDRQVNPGVASHGGHVDLIEVREGTAYIQLGGGCQGCAQVDVTLGQGIRVAILAAVPEIVAVVDSTDHAAGTNPYYEPSKK